MPFLRPVYIMSIVKVLINSIIDIKLHGGKSNNHNAMQRLKQDILPKDLKKGRAYEFVIPLLRKRAPENACSSEPSFSDVLVGLVCREYPRTAEEASVLISKVWHIIDGEIMKDLNQKSSGEAYKVRIMLVSTSYNIAVDRLRAMNKPLLKYGAVAEYYNSSF